ncbi:MAG TPA: dihydrolipoyllysine-residue acetyltransferase [Rhodanobacteraceae bacterium]|nr:dihydrolipoyllysine-residue acetyltransferase [Rhodanobacteraceae bacterium]
MATREARVPDIGNYTNVPVIEVLVKAGDAVTKDQGLVTLESDKATMEVPAPFDGVVKEVKVKVGDEVSEGAVVAVIEEGGAASAKPSSPPPRAGEADAQSASGQGSGGTASQEPPAPRPSPASGRAGPFSTPEPTPIAGDTSPTALAREERAMPATPPVPFDASTVMPDKVPYASPAVRMIARELGVDLHLVKGSERKGRITKADVRAYVKSVLSGQSTAPRAGASGGGLNLLPWPQIDFSKFGEVSTTPLSKIRKISGANLARNWVMIPHVTQHDEADVTELEALRVALNKENEKAGIKLTMLAFLIKAVVSALKKYPEFNSSLDAGGENLTLKKYFHIGFAADTPNGLVVPVLRDADRKGVIEIATETGELAKKAREGKLGPAEMSGGCFSISSLGGIGGTSFTPIVNAPEVAILGVSKSQTKPHWDGKAFVPRLMLPLSLSYDHRVIDGAAAARFAAYLAQVLADMRRILL